MRGIRNRCSYMAVLVVLAGTSAALAVYPFDTITFDNSSSFTNNEDNSGDAGSWYFNLNPPPFNVRLAWSDGNPGLNGNHSVVWSSTDHTGNGGGSVALTADYAATKSGLDEKVGFSFDLTNTAVNASNISFYLMLAPSSAVNSNSADVYGGGMQDASSGYAQVLVNNSSGNSIGVSDIFVNGNNAGGGWNLGDPTYSGTSDKGTWEYISIPLDSTDNMLKGIVIQDYVDNTSTGRVLGGPVTMYIDDLSITPVPEPASLGLVGLGAFGLLVRRRDTV